MFWEDRCAAWGRASIFEQNIRKRNNKMKKVIMMLAAVAMAACAQAAMMSWDAFQCSGGEMFDLGYCNDLAAGDAIVLCLMDGDNVARVLDTALEEDKWYYGLYKFSYSERVIENGDVLKVLVKDASGNFFDLKPADNGPGLDPTVINTLTVSGLTDDGWFEEFIYATGNFSAAAVPEPTSGLMLLLGLAGLALKRKIA